MDIVIIFPHQLFETKYLPFKDIDTFFIVEEPLFFKDNERKLKFNLLKLIYQRASMRYYYDYLKTYFKVKYIEYDTNWYLNFKDKNIHIMDPIDNLLESRLKKHKLKLIIYETPYFLHTNNNLQEYVNNGGTFYQTSFYIYTRKKFNILMNNDKPIGGKYSYDKMNRNVLPEKNLKDFIEKNDIKITRKKYDNKYYNEAIKYCEQKFKNYYINYDSNNIYYVPITHEDSKIHFRNFLKQKIKYFGSYQDYVDKDEIEMFHSFISPMLNNGLLTPQYILNKTLNFYNIHHNYLYSIEGFIRQLNWREYSRFLYRYNKNMIGNYFNNKNTLTKSWFDGTLGIEPIDTLIKKAFLNGYLHHIERLMFVCNFMNLCRIHPNEVYKWFMVFALDSYDWIMINNVYSMGLYADGGTSTTKPYISSNNYIERMSNFKKNTWSIIWYILYYYFIYKNFKKLNGRGFYYQLQWKKLKNKEDIIKQAKKIYLLNN